MRFSLLIPLLLLTRTTAAPPDITRVQCGKLRLGFSKKTGQWRSLEYRGIECLGGRPGGPADFSLKTDRGPWPAAAAWTARPPAPIRGARGIRIFSSRRSRHWEVTAIFRIQAETPNTIRRRVRVRWLGPGRVKIVRAFLRVPGITLGNAPDAVWAVPEDYPAAEHPLRSTPEGFSERERGWTWAESGIAFAHAPREKIGLALAYALEQDRALVGGEQGKNAVSLGHEFFTAVRLGPGDATEIGDQWIRIATGDRNRLKTACQDLAAAVVNGGPPLDRPAWLSAAVLMELHPWGRLEDWPLGDQGRRFPQLTAELPALQKLGVTAIWLMPVSEKPPWVYRLPQFRYIDPALGTPEQLRQLFATAHRLGLHALMDLVTYGVAPDSPDAAKLPPNVWCRDEHGRPEKVWGNSVLAADCGNPAWRELTLNRTRYWVRKFGCDGFRLDCGGDGQAYNWHAGPGRHANAATLAGGIGQNLLIRKAIREIDPEAVLLPEAGSSCHFRAGDMLFDYPLYRALREITRVPDTGRWLRRLRRWLDERQFTLSPRQEAALVRFLENHDCVAAQDFFGVGPAQALTALITFLPGVTLLYQEEPTGLSPALQRWLQLRQTLPALRTGRADYLAVHAGNPLVFAFLRYTPRDAAVVAVNFSPSPVDCSLAWPRRFDPYLRNAREALSGTAPAAGNRVHIPPWRPVVLTPRSPPRNLPGPEPASASLLRTREARKLEHGRRRFLLRFAPLDRWFVQTHEGLLFDRFPGRPPRVKPGVDWVDAAGPWRRCWRPLAAGLLDGPGPAALGGISRDGRVVVVRFPNPARLQDIRIEDPGGLGRNVQVRLEQPDGPPQFTITETRLSPAFLERLHTGAIPATLGPVTLDPLWARITLPGARLAIARRHGGAPASLQAEPGGPSLLAGPAEVYSDWGLFLKGLHAGSDWETNPRLELRREAGAVRLAFRGRLRHPSWNGVQAGRVMPHGIRYRLEYAPVSRAGFRITLGVTPETNRPQTQAFFALRIPFAGVERWTVIGPGHTVLTGRRGQAPGRRVFQTASHDWGRAAITIRLQGNAGNLALHLEKQAGGLPQNVFLLEDGAGRFTLFFALLCGRPIALEAGREIHAAFRLELE